MWCEKADNTKEGDDRFEYEKHSFPIASPNGLLEYIAGPRKSTTSPIGFNYDARTYFCIVSKHLPLPTLQYIRGIARLIPKISSWGIPKLPISPANIKETHTSISKDIPSLYSTWVDTGLCHRSRPKNQYIYLRIGLRFFHDQTSISPSYVQHARPHKRRYINHVYIISATWMVTEPMILFALRFIWLVSSHSSDQLQIT